MIFWATNCRRRRWSTQNAGTYRHYRHLTDLNRISNGVGLSLSSRTHAACTLAPHGNLEAVQRIQIPYSSRNQYAFRSQLFHAHAVYASHHCASLPFWLGQDDNCFRVDKVGVGRARRDLACVLIGRFFQLRLVANRVGERAGRFGREMDCAGRSDYAGGSGLERTCPVQRQQLGFCRLIESCSK